MRIFSPLPFLAVALALVPASAAIAQTTFDWTGTTSGDWSAASNWDPSTGAPPGTNATDIVRFDASSANTTVSLGSAASIGKLEFLDGADAYTISGKALTISAANGAVSIRHGAGNTQTISSDLILSATNTGTSRIMEAEAGSTLTLLGGLTVTNGSNINITFRGGGTLNIKGALSNINNFTANGAGTVINYDNGAVGASTGRPYTFTASNGGQVNLWRTNFSGSLAVTGDNASVYAKVAGAMVGSTNTQTLNPSANGIVTLGADIAGGGTASFGRQTKLNDNANNATICFDAKASNILEITGAIVDTDTTPAGTGTRVEIAGAGKVRFSGSSANTSKTPVVITSGATLELGKSGGALAIADAGSITVNGASGSQGTLLLDGNDQIDDTTSLTLSGGRFNAATFNETLGSLTVEAAGGVIEFSAGSASSVTFSDIASIAGTLTITGWNENVSIVFTDGSLWNETTLALVNFTGFGAAQFDAATGLLTASAIPEPATIAALLGGIAAMGSLFIRVRHRHF